MSIPLLRRPCRVGENGVDRNDRAWLSRTSGSHALAEQRSAQVREEAQRQVDGAQTALASAEAAIARMEVEGEE
jgi:hypothetical protein